MSKIYKGKTYRIIELDGNIYFGRDGHKKRQSNYIFNGFPQNYFKGSDILDIGCASGAILFEAYKKGMNEGVGVDIDHSKMDIGIDIAKKHDINNVKFFNINFFDDNDKSFDCVFILNLLHHLPDPYKILDFACKFSKEFICVEMPIDAMYVPYTRDKKTNTIFKSPLSANDFENYIIDKDFKCVYKRESNNQKNFKGVTRYVYIFGKFKKED